MAGRAEDFRALMGGAVQELTENACIQQGVALCIRSAVAGGALGQRGGLPWLSHLVLRDPLVQVAVTVRAPYCVAVDGLGGMGVTVAVHIVARMAIIAVFR